MSNIAIIPAKMHSERLPGKNTKLKICGKLLYMYAVEACIESKLFNDIVVSTDDIDIIHYNHKWKEVHAFIRSPRLCQPTTRAAEVIEDVLKLYNDYEFFCMPLLTSPLREAQDIVAGYNLIRDNPEVDFVHSVSQYQFSAYYALADHDDGELVSLVGQDIDKGKHQVPKTYYADGAVMWGRVSAFKGSINPLAPRTRYFSIPRERAVDIDDQLDFEFAEFLMKKKLGLLP